MRRSVGSHGGSESDGAKSTTDEGDVNKRNFLRRHTAITPGNEGDGEERAGQGLINKFLGRHDFDMAKLSKMMGDEAFKLKTFKNWDSHKQPIGNDCTWTTTRTSRSYCWST
ncbi:hypothetical protein PHYSODRAFT_289234 [Phytophthora sojae]|uniref:RxLR effector protein n=1 Tax=Phytophthora sojae (strain P6497) TaxID=1094619 RepID=G5AFX7_PHYSP|nr:hypothetical protein PHYSODRAFT_289234 [Phytophthora sojae]EGZ05493.1 hypothetical protein PHYSODRAFT_289234 [Phytophthora sojae]|eukprot:XP_009539024.1 hypothetical protein PHYSODRAFT_289234 [Phytophthora sojae]